MKKLSIGITTLLFATLMQASVTEANIVQPKTPLNIRQIESNNSIAGQELFNSACDAYFKAQVIEDGTEISKMYAKAISDISKACALEPLNADYLLLGSQIWRGKGGISYAKSYFAKAENLLKQKLDLSPNDIPANLDYAIICYAGDVRFWNNYSKYKKQAEKYAEKVITLCKDELKKEDNSNFVRVMAMANLVLDKQDECQELFGKAKQMDSEDKGFSLWKFLGFEEETVERESINIFYADLFENTVAKKQWLWKVDSKNIDKEFLLYYMTDEARNNNL